MITYFIVSIISGILFGILDGVINANPLARRLYKAYKPIEKTSINIPIGIIIDLFYGFIMAGIFLLIYRGLPGELGVVKGIYFALLVWFFRVVMSVASHLMMYKIPTRALLYTLLAGLCEMIILGLVYGFFLEPWT